MFGLSELIPTLTLGLDIAATLVFALSGALVAARKQMDIVGFCWLAIVTGVGGGTLRDLLIGAPVFWVQNPTPIVICLLVALLTHFTHDKMKSRYRYILWADAFGMALVTVAGTGKALALGLPAVVAVTMGVITATVGGIIRDILGQEPSVVLRKEIYVTAAFCGAVSFVLAQRVADAPWPSFLAVAVAAGIRLLALYFNWSMPTYRPRPGRSEAELRRLNPRRKP